MTAQVDGKLERQPRTVGDLAAGDGKRGEFAVLGAAQDLHGSGKVLAAERGEPGGQIGLAAVQRLEHRHRARCGGILCLRGGEAEDEGGLDQRDDAAENGGREADVAERQAKRDQIGKVGGQSRARSRT